MIATGIRELTGTSGESDLSYIESRGPDKEFVR